MEQYFAPELIESAEESVEVILVIFGMHALWEFAKFARYHYYNRIIEKSSRGAEYLLADELNDLERKRGELREWPSAFEIAKQALLLILYIIGILLLLPVIMGWLDSNTPVSSFQWLGLMFAAGLAWSSYKVWSEEKPDEFAEYFEYSDWHRNYVGLLALALVALGLTISGFL